MLGIAVVVLLILAITRSRRLGSQDQWARGQGRRLALLHRPELTGERPVLEAGNHHSLELRADPSSRKPDMKSGEAG
jgi:hypothetical protein